MTNIDVDDGYVSGAYSIEVNDGEDVTFTIKPADGKTITSVTGAALVSGNTYRITNIQTDVTVNVQIDEIKDMYTLTLMGSDFISDPGDNATVWTGAASSVPGTPVTEYGTTTAVKFQVPENTVITLVDDDITAGTYKLSDTVVGTAKAGSMTFTMDGNLTIDSTTLAASKLFAIHEGEDVELLEAGTSSGADDVAIIEINGIKYISSATAQYLTVKTTNADAVIAVANANDVKVAAAGQKVTGTKAAAGAEIAMTSDISADVYLYAASEVTFTGTGLTAKVGSTNLSSGDYVKVDETVVSSIGTPATNGTGVIADTTGSTKVGKNVCRRICRGQRRREPRGRLPGEPDQCDRHRYWRYREQRRLREEGRNPDYRCRCRYGH